MRFLAMTILATATAALPAAASVPQMVRQAIEQGYAEGAVDGPIADEARRKLNATGILSLSVKRVYLFEQPRCARVQLDFTQAAALLPGSALPAPYTWSTQMNICADGYPPSTLKRRSK
jgi:hypothetical protein